MGLYPARFRKAWGQQMLDAFRDLCRAERRRRRLLGSVRLWASAIADLVWNAFGERLAARTPSRGTSEPGRKGRGRERAGDLFQDLRQGLRGLLKQRGFTATALVLLALGIGANTAVFSLANAVLLGQLPFREPDRLVWVWSTRVDRDKAFFSIPNLMDF
jgi:putative ABC transport system permease protein